ncbi:MAG: rhodanese-like domain-containing protein [Betaproteobacteria bacterium]|nr:rhodanese-like domain-containing protein [Betaproteobacteria bacterium]
MYSEINALQLRQVLSENQNVLLIDVRTEAEVAYGVIDGAVHMPMHLVPLKADTLDPAQPTVFYCRSGARSGQVCAFLASRGHRNAYNLQGGVEAWLRAGEALAPAA